MGPGQVVTCHLDRLGVKNPDDGDVVCLWNVSWLEPSDTAVGPQRFYWILSYESFKTQNVVICL